MAIFLDHQTRSYLENLIKKRVEKSAKDFIAARIQGMLETDRNRLATMAACKYDPAHFIGEKDCCAKCGAYYDPGMGQSWTLDLSNKSESSPNE